MRVCTVSVAQTAQASQRQMYAWHCNNCHRGCSTASVVCGQPSGSQPRGMQPELVGALTLLLMFEFVLQLCLHCTAEHSTELVCCLLACAVVAKIVYTGSHLSCNKAASYRPLRGGHRKRWLWPLCRSLPTCVCHVGAHRPVTPLSFSCLASPKGLCILSIVLLARTCVASNTMHGADLRV